VAGPRGTTRSLTERGFINGSEHGVEIEKVVSTLEAQEAAAAFDIEAAFTPENREFSTGYRAAMRYALSLLRQNGTQHYRRQENKGEPEWPEAIATALTTAANCSSPRNY
jgi:hypothetical protein